MSIDFSTVKETIEINKERLQDSGELVDELLSDDALIALGYNKRHNPLVVHNKAGSYFQWSVSVKDDHRMMIHTVSLGDTEFLLSKDNLNSDFKYLLVTNYIDGALYRGEDGQLLIKLTTPELWDLISNKGFNPDGILEEYEIQLVNTGLMGEVLPKEEVISSLLEVSNIAITNRTKAKAKEVLADVLESSKKLEEVNTKLAQLESEKDELIKSSEEFKGQLKALQEEKVVLEDKLSKLTAEAEGKLKGVQEACDKQQKALEERFEELRKKHDSIQKKLEEAEFAKEEAKRALDEALANGATADRITDSELAKKFEALEGELAKTKSQLEAAQKIINEVTTSTSTGVNSQNESEVQAKLREELEKYRVKNEELQSEVSALKVEVSNLTELNGATNNSENSSEEVVLLKKTNDELHVQLAELQAKLSTYAGNSSLANSDLQAKYEVVLRDLNIERDKARLLQESTDAANRKAEELRKRLENSSSIADENEWNRLEAEYRQKISNLTMESLSYKEKVDELTAKIADMQEKEVTDKEIKETLAKSLIDAIEDDPNLERTYVGAVNSKLFQSRDLPRFAGICLEELYNIVEFRLLQELYDGSKFRWVTNPSSPDFNVNKKDYKFDMSGETEESLMEKITALFKQFADSDELSGKTIAFEYKVIGQRQTSVEEVNDAVEQPVIEGIEEVTGIAGEVAAENPAIALGGAVIEEVTMGIPIEMQATPPIDSIEEVTLDNSGVPVQKLLSVPLGQLGTVIWKDGITLNSIDYFGKGPRILKLKSESQQDNNKIATKAIDSILSLVDDFDKAVTLLNQVDLSCLSNLIYKLDDNTKNNPKISFSRFVVGQIDTLEKIAPILTGICESIEENPDNFSVFITVTQTKRNSEVASIIDEYECGREPITSETAYYSTNDTDELADAVINGGITGAVMLTRNSLEVHKQLFVEASAIKAQGIGANISTFDGKRKTITQLISGAPGAFNIEAVGAVLGESYQVISTTETKVGEEHYSIEVGGTTYFVSIMAEWQFIYAILKIYTVLYKNKKVGIKCKVNKSALSYYRTQFETNEPALSIAVRSIVDYIASKNSL